MGQLDVVTRQLAPNEHLRATDTRVQIAAPDDRPVVEVLSQTLPNVDVSVQRAEQLRSSAAASYDQTVQQSHDFNARFGHVVRSHYTLAAQLNQAVQALEGAEQNCAAAATTAAQYLAQKEAELAAAKAEAATLRESLARHLANANDRAADAEAAAERLMQRATEVVKVVEAHQNLERRFHAALVLLQEQDAILNATTERLTGRDAELAEATEKRLSLERQLAEAESAFGEAVRRSADDRSTAIQQAAQRQSEFEAVLREDVAKYDTLAQDLLATRQEFAHVDTMLQQAEARHALAMTTAEAQRHEQEARHEARMSEAAAARDAVSRQLLEATAAIDRVRQDHLASATTAAERLAQQEVKLREGTAVREMLEGQLADAHTALQAAEERAVAERLAARQREAEGDREFVALFDQEAAARETLEQALTVARNQVAETETAIRDAEHRHASHMTTVTARFADQQVQYETRLAEAAAARDLVDQRLREVEVSFERSRKESASDAAAAAERLARLEAQRVETLAHLQMLEGQLADANAALHVAEQCVRSERLTGERQAAQRQAEFEAAIALETAGRRAVQQDLATWQQKLAESESALRNADERHAFAMTSAAAEFAERQREFDTLSAQARAARGASDLRLREAEATLERIHGERAVEAIAVAEQLAQLESALAKATANGETLEQTRNTIEQALAATRQNLQQTEAALRDATAQHTKEMTSASNELSAQLTEQQRKYETRLAEVTTAREIVSQRLHDTETTLARIRQESDANAIASAEQLSQRESELAAASTAREVLEGRLVYTETALKHAEARALAERTATIQQLAQRRAEFDAQLAREVEARTIVERDLAENRVAADETRQALLGQSAALTAEMRELEVRLTQELARERADYEGNLADLQMQLRALNVERDAHRQTLATSLAQCESLSRVHEAANENFERIRQAKDIELQRLGDDYAVVRQTLDQVRADALQTLERVGSEHTAELVRINRLAAERDGQLKAVRQDFEETRSHRDGLQIEADRVPQLTNQLEASRAERRRQFDGSPIGILRCSEAGVLKEANRALLTTLGYRTVDELLALGSAASVFESPDDFRWLIATCETPSELVDWFWKKKDGSRLIMRLRALRLSADVVDIVAEDLTTLRAVEERLRRAQRMEAVGRLASEVADTCDILLRNVTQDGQQWLATVGSNAAQRHQGELILGEVTRAAGFLRQLSVYGEKQTSALAEVDVNTVLRDLAPVLKRVAGDDIELVLPRKVFTLSVDVDAERVERVLVNIAAYGRARMPSGGRLIIELARVVVDRDFVTKYPNVRQGAHALISVAEVRTAAPAEWPTGIREPAAATAIGATSERPGVDVGALQALISDCGGHLWMKAEPGGDMELKIHLPLRSADTSRRAGVVRSALGRSVSSWFQS